MKIAACIYGREGTFEKGEIKYVEGSAADIALLPKEDFFKLFRLYETREFEMVSANKFVWGDYDISKEGYDAGSLKKYVKLVGDRLSALGCPKVVLGSGRARRLDRQYGIKKGRAQFFEFLDFSCDVLAKYDMNVVIEPLNSKETNFINTVPDGYNVSLKSGKDNCGVLCDYFHFTEENEPFSDIVSSKDRLMHIHIAHPGDRNVPLPEDGHDYSPFFKTLSEAGYDGHVSIEARKSGREDLLRSMAHLQKYADKYKKA